MTVISIHGHRRIGRGSVDQLFGGQLCGAPLGLIPIAAEQPAASGSLRGTLANAEGKFLRAGPIIELHIVELRAAIPKTQVGILETRQPDPPAGIEQASIGTTPRPNLLV